MDLHNSPLKPMSAQEALDALRIHFLGEEWVCVDPLGPTRVNALIVDDIIRAYPNHRKEKKSLSSKFFEKGR